MQRQGNEPPRLACTGAGAGDGGVLLEQRQEECALGREMPIKRALGEAGRQRDLVERGELKATVGEQIESRRDQQGAGFYRATLVRDTHGYL